MAWTAQHQEMVFLIPAHCDALALTHSVSTINDRRRCLRRLHNDLPLGVAWATTVEIRAWLANPAWTEATRYTYTGHVLAAYRWWTAEGYLDGDPTVRIVRPRQPKGEPRPAAEEHIAALLGLAEPIPTITLLGAYAGLRRAEIAACRREHITEALVLVPRGKGGRPGKVPTHPLIWEHVRDLPPGPLVRDRAGRPVNPQQVSRMWRRAREALGLPELVPHQLRHRFGTMVRKERDVLAARDALRHASVATTEIYTQVTDAEVATAVRALPAVHRPAAIRPVPPADEA